MPVVNKDECIGCGACVDVCEPEAITLNDNELAVLSAGDYSISDFQDRKVQRETETIDWPATSADKKGFEPRYPFGYGLGYSRFLGTVHDAGDGPAPTLGRVLASWARRMQWGLTGLTGSGWSAGALSCAAVHAVLRSRAVSADDIVGRLAAARLHVDSVEAVEPSLEDVFLDVVEKAGRE